ncbi:Hypothetical predicted protein [Cloeon dipterum]|uniref:Uncharacterized protein n=1 Tax=Cloeon dipterum TaxID=197152 RepID=A0A8S1CBP8_9INSE|nr:Hypothetical predicted protein [Cloeon dipterum]
MWLSRQKQKHFWYEKLPTILRCKKRFATLKRSRQAGDNERLEDCTCICCFLTFPGILMLFLGLEPCSDYQPTLTETCE